MSIDRPRWRENLPFWGVHVAAIVGAISVGWSWAAAAWLVGGYAVRMFAITAGYHRYFAHRTYKTSRWFQFVLALLGLAAAQQGPLWWAAHHRRHHKYSDEPEDVHSPRQRGFWWSHVGWIVSSRHKATDYGATALFWGHFVALVACWHVTFCINSLAHVWGTRRYATGDDSRNNGLLAVLTFGEGWHNNHHHYQRSARQGFYWWELDVSYYALRALELVGIVRDVESVPRHVRDDEIIVPTPSPAYTSTSGRSAPG